jgi:predicted nucleotidyltransferase
MNTQPDFEELLRLLEKHNVDYMIVGGYAVAFHGHPRFTKDIDVFFDATTSNIDAIRNALCEFGFKKSEIPPELFCEPGNIVTFGAAPVRVDIINEIDGVSYADARVNRVRGSYGGVDVSFIGCDDLIMNKKATPRSKDKLDAEELERVMQEDRG